MAACRPQCCSHYRVGWQSGVGALVQIKRTECKTCQLCVEYTSSQARARAMWIWVQFIKEAFAIFTGQVQSIQLADFIGTWSCPEICEGFGLFEQALIMYMYVIHEGHTSAFLSLDTHIWGWGLRTCLLFTCAYLAWDLLRCISSTLSRMFYSNRVATISSRPVCVYALEHSGCCTCRQWDMNSLRRSTAWCTVWCSRAHEASHLAHV